MSNLVQTYKPKLFGIETEEGKKLDITNSILAIDYFEDLLSPAIHLMVHCTNKYSIVSGLPIRGGEKVEIDIETGSGIFEFIGDQNSLRVYKVSGQEGTRMAERFTLHITTQEYMKNEISRCFRKYTGKISESVKDVLKNDLKTTKFLDENIEESANAYKWIGSMRKPFKVLEWLCPKSMSSRAGESDPDPKAYPSEQEKARGTMGFFFYENREGFNFKSMDKLCELIGSARAENVPNYKYTGKIIKSADFDNALKIIDYAFDRNIDVRSALRFGLYKNHTFLLNTDDNQITVYNYDITEEIGNKKLGRQEGLSVPADLKEVPSRIIVRATDNGIMSSGGGSEETGRSPADRAKSAARYNLLFTQSLNILIPCNVNLKVGDVINCEFSEMNSGRSKEPDKEISGRYLIRELRHHFSPSQNTSSLRLIRDSYGLN